MFEFDYDKTLFLFFNMHQILRDYHLDMNIFQKLILQKNVHNFKTRRRIFFSILKVFVFASFTKVLTMQLATAKCSSTLLVNI